MNKPDCRTENRACGLCCTKIQGLSVTLGKREILKNIDLHFHCGELTAIVGQNGAGKTTLLKAMLGETPYTGKIGYHHFSRPHPDRPKIGYVPQKLEFDAGSPVSVLDIFGAALSQSPVWLGHSKKFIERAKKSLARVQADHLINARIGELSGGELQRAMLALALDPIPDLLLLDEPVSGVDRSGMKLFYNLVSEIRRENDLSVVLVSHDLDLVAQVADRVAFLDNALVSIGKPEDVYRHERFVQSFGKIPLEQISNLQGGEND